MSVALLLQDNSLNIKCSSITCTTVNALENEVENFHVTQNLGVDGDAAVSGQLELASNANPWVNLAPQNGQVLGYVDDELAFISNTAEGSIAAGINISINVVGDVHEISTVADPVFDSIQCGDINLPTSYGLGNQILATNSTSDALEWVNIAESGTISAGTNIDVNTVGSNSTISTIADVVFDTVQCGAVDLPIAYGDPNQILATNSAGDALEWITPTEAGTIISGLNIDISTVGSTSTISTIGDPVFNTVQCGVVSLPSTYGSSNQILATNSAGNGLEWKTESPTGTIANQDGNLSLSTVGANTDINLANDININNTLSIGTTNSYTLPSATALTNAVQYALVPTANVLSFAPVDQGVQSLAGGSNISVSAATGNITVNLDADLTIDSTTMINGDESATLDSAGLTISNTATPSTSVLTANLINTPNVITKAFTMQDAASLDVYTLPTTLGTAGQCIGITDPATPNLTWVTPSGATGVSSVNTTLSNLTVSPTTGDVNIELANIINIETVGLTNELLVASGAASTSVQTDRIVINNLTPGFDNDTIELGLTNGLITSKLSMINPSTGATLYSLPQTSSNSSYLKTTALGVAEWNNTPLVETVNSGTNILMDSSDPRNPIVSTVDEPAFSVITGITQLSLAGDSITTLLNAPQSTTTDGTILRFDASFGAFRYVSLTNSDGLISITQDASKNYILGLVDTGLSTFSCSFLFDDSSAAFTANVRLSKQKNSKNIQIQSFSTGSVTSGPKLYATADIDLTSYPWLQGEEANTQILGKMNLYTTTTIAAIEVSVLLFQSGDTMTITIVPNTQPNSASGTPNPVFATGVTYRSTEVMYSGHTTLGTGIPINWCMNSTYY